MELTIDFSLGDTIYFYNKKVGWESMQNGIIKKICITQDMIEYTDNESFTVNNNDYEISADEKQLSLACLDNEEEVLRARLDKVADDKEKIRGDNKERKDDKEKKSISQK